jgi:DNA mismatch endonuclease (patch repair protein)
MADVFSKEKRSEIMSHIRGKGTRSTEGKLRNLLIDKGIEGWREAASDIYGKPDFVFDQERVAIFVDGCFWHGCAECRNIPESNREFWEKKIFKTKARDQEVVAKLSEEGWTVIRFWEHELKKKNIDHSFEKLAAILAAQETNITASQQIVL